MVEGVVDVCGPWGRVLVKGVFFLFFLPVCIYFLRVVVARGGYKKHFIGTIWYSRCKGGGVCDS